MPRILLLDDDEALRLLLARILRAAGYEVADAPDGATGLRLWRERGADLVVTDLHMPDTNGIEVILALQTYAPALPVIAMSGGQRALDLDLLGSAQLLGAVRVLAKPFSKEEFLAAVREATGGG